MIDYFINSYPDSNWIRNRTFLFWKQHCVFQFVSNNFSQFICDAPKIPLKIMIRDPKEVSKPLYYISKKKSGDKINL
jgi:hypothetical protein